MNYLKICYRCKIEQAEEIKSFSADNQIGKWAGYRICESCSQVVIEARDIEWGMK